MSHIHPNGDAWIAVIAFAVLVVALFGRRSR